MKVLSLLPLVDWLALAAFFALWIGYAWFARFWGIRQRSLIATTNRYRGFWMLQATARDPRMLDGVIVQNLSHTPSFFSSTSIIIIGGLFALLGTTDKAAELVREIPFAQPTPILVFEFKILVLVGIFVYAFFRFAARLNLPVVATHPVQFTGPRRLRGARGAGLHRRGRCAGQPAAAASASRPSSISRPAPRWALFADLPSALANSVEIARRCNLTLVLGKPQLPDFPTPGRRCRSRPTSASESHEGLEERLALLYPDAARARKQRPRYVERLDFEIAPSSRWASPATS
jgi:hypothetical protein